MEQFNQRIATELFWHLEAGTGALSISIYYFPVSLHLLTGPSSPPLTPPPRARTHWGMSRRTHTKWGPAHARHPSSPKPTSASVLNASIPPCSLRSLPIPGSAHPVHIMRRGGCGGWKEIVSLTQRTRRRRRSRQEHFERPRTGVQPSTLASPSGLWYDLTAPQFPINCVAITLKRCTGFIHIISVVSGTTESWGFEESNSLQHYLQSLWILFSDAATNWFEFGYAGVDVADPL